MLIPAVKSRIREIVDQYRQKLFIQFVTSHLTNCLVMANKAVFIVLIVGFLSVVDCVPMTVRNKHKMPEDCTPVSVDDKLVKKLAVYVAADISAKREYGILYVSKISKAGMRNDNGIKYYLGLELQGVVTKKKFRCHSIVSYDPQLPYYQSQSDCTASQ